MRIKRLFLLQFVTNSIILATKFYLIKINDIFALSPFGGPFLVMLSCGVVMRIVGQAPTASLLCTVNTMNNAAQNPIIDKDQISHA